MKEYLSEEVLETVRENVDKLIVDYQQMYVDLGEDQYNRADKIIEGFKAVLVSTK